MAHVIKDMDKGQPDVYGFIRCFIEKVTLQSLSTGEFLSSYCKAVLREESPHPGGRRVTNFSRHGNKKALPISVSL